MTNKDNERHLHNMQQLSKLRDMHPGESLHLSINVRADKVDEVLAIIKEHFGDIPLEIVAVAGDK